MGGALWRVQPSDLDAAATLGGQCGLSPRIAQLLLNRGLRQPDEVRRFLAPSLAQLQDPRRLSDMSAAVARLQHAVAVKEPILVFGDSDVDGITAAAILYEALTSLGGKVVVRISHRLDDGYGFPRSMIRRILRSRVRVVVLVDCGTNQPDEIHELARAGVDTIVLDHHVLAKRAARPLALVNPRRDQDDGQACCSAGLAFKLAQALCPDDDERLAGWLDLATLGTLADYATLVGDNRAIVAEGLNRILSTRRPGLQRLCQAMEVTKATPDQILKRLVPRLNAAGRVGNPRPVWRLLVEQSPEAAARYADHLADCHATSKGYHRQILSEAYEQASRLHFKDQYVMVLGQRGWHRGLMGPIAAQLVDRYARPAISIAVDGSVGTGSGRSVSGFDLFAALRACEGLLLRYGGHPQACGLSIEAGQLERFREQINQHAKTSFGRQRLVQTLEIDAEWTMRDLTVEVVSVLERFKPFGPGNRQPLLLWRGVGVEADGAKKCLTDGECSVGLRERALDLETSCQYDLVGTPTVQDGQVIVSVRDARPAQSEDAMRLGVAAAGLS